MQPSTKPIDNTHYAQEEANRKAAPAQEKPRDSAAPSSDHLVRRLDQTPVGNFGTTTASSSSNNSSGPDMQRQYTRGRQQEAYNWRAMLVV